jgi:hypothetical protein
VLRANVTKVALTRSPGAGGDSSEGVRGVTLGVVGGLREVASDGAGLGGSSDATLSDTEGFSTPMPTGLLGGVDVPAGGVYVGRDEVVMKYRMAQPKTAKRMYRTKRVLPDDMIDVREGGGGGGESEDEPVSDRGSFSS